MEQEMRILSPAVSGRRSPLLHQYLRQYSSADYSAFSPRTPLTPSSASFDEDDEEEVDNRLYLAGLSLQRQDFLSRYELCLSHLHEAVREARTLRLENAQLRVANADLAQRLKELSSPRRMASTSASAALEKEMRRLRIGDPVASSPPAEASPTSVLQMAKVNALPKSISVRSTGYKKMISPEGEPKRSGRIRVSTPVAIGSQRVFVGASSSSGSGSGGKKEKKKELVVELKKEEQQEEAAGLVGVELDVYNQGMFKTELCNKWQESGGNCPYGENCQFAHGISELRPVIRHPRYKTEVCRMVLAGDPCPYGHRCHFRHALSPHQSNLHHL